MTAVDSTAQRSSPTSRVNTPAMLTFLCLGQFMVFLDVSVVNLALPSIQRGLGMSEVSLNYVVTAYGTVLGGFLLLSGRLADTLGRRRMLRAGFLVFALASLGSGLAQNRTMLITARGVQGCGAAMIATAALSILTNTFREGAERTKALGVWGSLAGGASIVGVVLGGVLAGGPGWRWIFWMNVPIGLAVAALAPSIVPESRTDEQRPRFDTLGAAAFTGGLLLLIFTVGEATRIGWSSTRTVVGLAGAAMLLVAFVSIETHVASPMLPLHVFRLRTMRIANISAVLVFGLFSAMFFFVSIFMQQVYGYSPTTAGFAYLPLAVCVAIGAGVASGLITKLAARPVLVAGLAVTIAGLVLLWRTDDHGTYVADLLVPFLLLGLGCGMVYVTLQIAAFVGVDDAQAGVGAGLINTSQEVGGALGLALVATIAYSGLSTKLATAGHDRELVRVAQASANQHAFLAATCIGVVALLIAAFLMPRPARTTS